MRRILFPPGDTRLFPPSLDGNGSGNQRHRSRWREYEFWFMMLQHAVVPRISMKQAFQDWNRIRRSLMENRRERELQSDYITSVIS